MQHIKGDRSYWDPQKAMRGVKACESDLPVENRVLLHFVMLGARLLKS
jgi:hypothetical protein